MCPNDRTRQVAHLAQGQTEDDKRALLSRLARGELEDGLPLCAELDSICTWIEAQQADVHPDHDRRDPVHAFSPTSRVRAIGTSVCIRRVSASRTRRPASARTTA